MKAISRAGGVFFKIDAPRGRLYRICGSCGPFGGFSADENEPTLEKLAERLRLGLQVAHRQDRLRRSDVVARGEVRQFKIDELLFKELQRRLEREASAHDGGSIGVGEARGYSTRETRGA